jgi:dCTP diphosphatase
MSTPTVPFSPDHPNPKATSDLLELRDIVRQFARERDWEQFHTPKNLVMALSVEVAELMEHFQWLKTGSEHELNDQQRIGIRHELADSLVYLIRLADCVNVDLRSAVIEKMQLNREKYPIDKVKGQSRKYSDY